MPALPRGTVTFLFTDIEGSTRLLQQLGDTRAAEVFEEHRQVLREAFVSGGGHELETQGDGFLVVFQSARDAVLTAVAAQRAVAAHRWPDGVALRVRMGLHTGEPAGGPTGYVGLDLHRAHRVSSVGWGGQILVSESTRRLVERDLPPDAGLRDLGTHRLKDLTTPERICQVVHADLPWDFPPLRSLDSLPNNLPRQLTSFVGREREMAEVGHLVTASRLVTLTGSGGCGKTRLALQTGADMVDGIRDGVWLVELAALSDPALVPQAVATALHVREQPGRPLAAALADYLRDRDLVLILDNCEHLVGACAHLADDLLRTCPGLRLLATSQEPLRVAGEVTWQVPPLVLPDRKRLPPLERLTQNEAVRLFAERAAAALPGFALTEGNARWIVDICHRLDGLPLAIELAAARVRVLTVEQIAARLDDRFRLLTGGGRTTLPRHQTLRATMDWSYELLPDPERTLLRRLSVFAGGFTLEAAETVCAGDGMATADILNFLSTLIDRSMVTLDARGTDTRYGLLETVRQYAREKLVETGQETAVRQQHLDWFLSLAERSEAARGGPQEASLDRLETEHDNLRAALEHALRGGAPAAGIQLAGALRMFWLVRGYWTEGRHWLEALLAGSRDISEALRAKALNAAATLAQYQGDYDRARILSEESLAIQRALGDAAGTARSLNVLGNVRYEQGDYRAARKLHEESLEYARGAGDVAGAAASLANLAVLADHEGDHTRAMTFAAEGLAAFRSAGDKRGAAYVLNILGMMASDRGDYGTARAHVEEGLGVRRELGDRRGTASSLDSLGLIARQQGDYPAAQAFYEESLATRRELGDRHGIAAALRNLGLVAWHQGTPDKATILLRESLVMRNALGNQSGIADCLEGLAQVSLDAGRTARLFAAAGALREVIGAPIPASRRSEYDSRLAVTRTGLGAAAYQTAWDEGSTMTSEQAVRFALSDRTEPAGIPSA